MLISQKSGQKTPTYGENGYRRDWTNLNFRSESQNSDYPFHNH